MGRVLSNNTAVAYAVEASLGVLAGSPVWKTVEPNDIKKIGSSIKTTSRNPISKSRQRRKGTVTDLDSTAELDCDLTLESFNDFIEGYIFANLKGTAPFSPSAVTSTAYTVASGGALAQNTLIYARGFSTSGNNGLKVVGASSTGTSIKASGLTAETPPANAVVEVCGVRGAAGDLQINSSGNLISTVLDFTTLGLVVGQGIWIGGDATANSFFGTTNRGYARVKTIAAHVLTLDKRSAVFTTDDGTTTGSGGTALLIDIFFGRFVRNVAVDHADYAEKSYQFEVAYKNLGSGSTDRYEYSKGNYCNTAVFDMPLAAKATVTFGFTGTDTPVPTATRATNAATPSTPLRTTAFNTSADLGRLRITQVDETGLTTDFRSLKVTLNNNVSPEKVLGTLGAKYINTGNFNVDIEADLIFTESAVVDAIRNNTTVTMDFAVRNADGAILVDIPSLTLGDGAKGFPVNESVTLKTNGESFKDDTYSTSIGVTVFPYVPAA